MPHYPAIYEEKLALEYVTPMKAGKIMKGYVHIAQEGFSTAPKLGHWLQLCLDYNPLAKSSKK